jgi:hypothetical protein
MSKLDPIQTTKLVLHVIDEWLKSNGAGGFRADRTIKDNPPKGYGMTQQRYWKFCDDISGTLSKLTGRRLVLKKAWRDQHYSDAMGVFASAVTLELLSAPETATGKRLRAVAVNLTQ